MPVALIEKAIKNADVWKLNVIVQHNIDEYGSKTVYFLSYSDREENNTSTMKFDHIGKLLAYIRSLI